jgi:hypothetical protein
MLRVVFNCSHPVLAVAELPAPPEKNVLVNRIQYPDPTPVVVGVAQLPDLLALASRVALQVPLERKLRVAVDGSPPAKGVASKGSLDVTDDKEIVTADLPYKEFMLQVEPLVPLTPARLRTTLSFIETVC